MARVYVFLCFVSLPFIILLTEKNKHLHTLHILPNLCDWSRLLSSPSPLLCIGQVSLCMFLFYGFFDQAPLEKQALSLQLLLGPFIQGADTFTLTWYNCWVPTKRVFHILHFPCLQVFASVIFWQYPTLSSGVKNYFIVQLHFYSTTAVE